MHKKTILPVLACFVCGPLLAQVDSAAVKNDLGEVVVTGQYSPQSLKRSVYNVRVITKERIAKQGATRLQDVLANEMNIRFSQDLALGGSDITMQGLSGQNVKILIDGVPMIGRQGTSNEININQVDVQTIERIEIVEGPMSVVYGADALAGVINIITKRPPIAKVAVTAGIHEESVGKEYGLQKGIHNEFINASWQRKRWEFAAGINNNRFMGWQGDAPDHDKKWNPKNQWMMNAVAGYRWKKTNMHYRLDVLDETIMNPGAFVNDEAFNQQYLSKRYMQQLMLNTTPSTKISLNAVASYTMYSRRTLSTTEDKLTGDERLALGEGQQDKTKFDGGMVRTNMVYKISGKVALQPGIDVNFESSSGERIGTATKHISDYAFFITSEIMPIPILSIKPGIRMIQNSVYDAPPVIPALNARLSLMQQIEWRFGYARGFRAPSLRELYFYFHDASHSIEGNPSLQAELSNSFNTAFTWRPMFKSLVSYTLSLGGFYNRITNMIDYAAKVSNPTITTYINVARYKTTGLTLENTVIWKELKATMGFGYTGRYNQYAATDNTLPSFKWSPELNSNLSYRFTKCGLDINLYYKFTGKLPYYEQATVDNQVVVRLAATKGYHWADFTANKTINKLLTLNAGARNLFNVVQVANTAVGGGAHSETGARPIGYGRSYFVGLVLNVNSNTGSSKNQHH